MEEEKAELETAVSELKAKCEYIEKKEAEKRVAEERKHSEEISFLKKTNAQLKVTAKLNVDPIGRNFGPAKEMRNI